MKIIVDTLPNSCSACLFSKMIKPETDRYSSEHECKITEDRNDRSDYEIHKNCPLIALDNNLSVDVEQYTSWEEIMQKTIVRFNGQIIYENKECIGDSGWKDY